MAPWSKQRPLGSITEYWVENLVASQMGFLFSYHAGSGARLGMRTKFIQAGQRVPILEAKEHAFQAVL